MVKEWLKHKIETWKAQRKLAEQVDPRAIKEMAADIRDLALLAAQLNLRSSDINKQIKDIVAEMDRLNDLADRPEFKKLSMGKRLLLRQGLLESREQLLESIEAAPSPTRTLQ